MPWHGGPTRGQGRGFGPGRAHENPAGHGVVGHGFGAFFRRHVFQHRVLVRIVLMHHRKDSGIYNLGSGKARTFLSLAENTFKAMNKPVNIEFIDTPADIRDKYQYFTEASMNKVFSGRSILSIISYNAF